MDLIVAALRFREKLLILSPGFRTRFLVEIVHKLSGSGLADAGIADKSIRQSINKNTDCPGLLLTSVNGFRKVRRLLSKSIPQL